VHAAAPPPPAAKVVPGSAEKSSPLSAIAPALTPAEVGPVPNGEVATGPPADVQRQCDDCGQHFTWSASEQGFYAAHKYAPPKRCKRCQKAKRTLLKAAALGASAVPLAGDGPSAAAPDKGARLMVEGRAADMWTFEEPLAPEVAALVQRLRGLLGRCVAAEEFDAAAAIRDALRLVEDAGVAAQLEHRLPALVAAELFERAGASRDKILGLKRETSALLAKVAIHRTKLVPYRERLLKRPKSTTGAAAAALVSDVLGAIDAALEAAGDPPPRAASAPAGAP